MHYFTLCIGLLGLIYATHLMGGEITLECLNAGTSPPTYRIRVRVYRDCAGISQPSSISIRRQSTSCNVNTTFTLNRVSVTDITPVCPGQQSNCNGGSGPYGWEEHVYEGTIQLQNCNDWILSYTDCCRNSAITTGSNDEDYFIYIRVNTLDAPCNNTPRYTNPPTALACNGQSFCFNPGMSDPDGDRLEVSLTNCRSTDVNTSVTYNATCPGGCSGSNPLPATAPPTVNTTNGTVCLTPNAAAVGPICILVREYRGATLIGEYLRDMQVRVISCTGAPPQASAVNGTLPANPYDPNNPGTYTAYFCPGVNQCFNLQFRDPDNQPVTVTWTNLPPGASFTVTGNNTITPNAQFCWNPPSNGTFTFYVTLQDNNCPVRNTATYGYTVVVNNQVPQPTSFTYNCGANTVIVNFNAPINCSSIAANGSDFQFVAPAGSPTITGATGIGCGTSAQQVQLTLSGPLTPGTTYTLRIRTGTDGNTLCSPCGSCVPNNTDFNIPVQAISGSVSISPNNPTICRGSWVTLTANTSGPTPTNYIWYANGSCTGAPISSGATANQITVNPTSNTTYCVRVQYGGGCPDATATTTVTVNRAPTACFTVSPAAFCAGQTVTLNPSCSQYVRSCGGSCLVPCDNNAQCPWPITCQSAACGHFSYWLLSFPPYFQPQGLGASSLNSLNVTFPAPGEYTVEFTLCEPFQSCCHTVRQRFTVSCVLSAWDVQLQARRKDASQVALSWAVNARDPYQRFHVMRRTEQQDWQVVASREGEVYSCTDEGLLPGRYFYQVSQVLPTGSVLMSNIAEVVLLPEGSVVAVETRPRSIGEGVEVFWSLAEREEGGDIVFYDVAGRRLYQVPLAGSEGSLTIPSPEAAGVYLLRVETPTRTQVFRLVWQ
ncbi:MAG: T9SS type A sorting domain-containing protein [Bacteroidia bacterium]|nr:T9SS type A sorting domain-containing protein [Bacteroidia bacterium]